MQKALAITHETYGVLHGVIHAAGIAGGGLIQTKTAGTAASVLDPKIKGALVVSELLAETPLDFLLFCSSINSILNAVGQTDYCAANAFLDAYAHYLTRKGRYAISVNWDTWQEVGMAVNTPVPMELKAIRNESLRLGISPAEAQRVFSHILAAQLPQIILSTQHLPTVIEQHARSTLSHLASLSLINTAMEASHGRPNLSVAFVAAETEIEQAIVAIWEELLGIKGIGVEDDFFDLGGHSLLGSQVLARFRELFGIEMSLDTIFNMPTIIDLAIAVEDKILAEIEN